MRPLCYFVRPYVRLPCILLVIGTIIYLRFGACEAVRFKFGYALLSYICLNLDKRVSVINMNLIVREKNILRRFEMAKQVC